jgi:transcription antitermination factor NusG
MTRGTLDLGAWCILLSSNGKTLELAASLTEDSYEAWAPVTREVTRTTEQRTREEVAVPLMPGGYVFARADRLADLLALSHSPSLQYRVWDTDLRKMVTKGHPYFRVFRSGNHRLIPDQELEPLRRLERKPRAKRVERTFAVGDSVRTDDGGFAGLTGIVVSVKGKRIAVAFPKWGIEPVFPSWALRPLDEHGRVQVSDAQPERDAAKAA